MLPDEVLQLLKDAGLGAPRDAVALSGGVSSEIWRVDLPAGPVCVKRALPRLRVSEVWEAPVERNAYEFEWFRVAGEAVPKAVPRTLAHGHGAFAMEYLPPERYPVWKAQLRDGHADPRFAAQVGERLGAIHAATRERADLAERFATGALFHALRLEPYLHASSRKNPRVAGRLVALAERTANTKACLVHGDVSPKNILAGPQGPVFLDAECAWYGDPAFDLAFCLNHLLLKCLWNPRAVPGYLECFDALHESYSRRMTGDVEARAATLLPALLLARVDGKSPVEYLTEQAQKARVRTAAIALLEHPMEKLHDVKDAWHGSLT